MPNDAPSTNSRPTMPLSSGFSADSPSSGHRPEATSDEPPDLGAFATILRTWNQLQPPPRPTLPQSHSFPSSLPPVDRPPISFNSFSRPEGNRTEASEAVWSQRQFQSDFNSSNTKATSERQREHESTARDNPTAGSRPSYPPFDAGGVVGTFETTTSDTKSHYTNSSRQPRFDEDQERGAMAVPMAGFRQGDSRSVAAYGVDYSFEHAPLLSREPSTLRTGHELRHSSPYTTSTQNTPLHSTTVTQSQFNTQTKPSQSLWPTPSTLRGGVTEHPTIPQSRPFGPIDDRSSVNVDSKDLNDDPERAVLSLLSQARARTLGNDNPIASTSTTNHSPNGTTARPADAREPTPESRSLPFGPHTHSFASQSESLLAQALTPSFATTSSSYSYEHLPQRLHSFSPQVEPPSPLPTPERRVPVSNVTTENVEAQVPVRARPRDAPASETERYLLEGVAHPYPHSLKGHHTLPASMEKFEGQRRLDTIQHELEADLSVDVDNEPLSGKSDDGEYDPSQPSLGLLDEALGFIAAERAKREAARANGPQSGGDGSNARQDNEPLSTKRKRRRKKTSKGHEETGIQLSESMSGLSATRPLLLAARPETDPVTHETTEKRDTPAKHITILSRPKPSSGSEETKVESPPLVLTGKKGNRVGRKERERAKAKRDKERLALEQATQRPEDDWDADNDDLDEDEEDDGDLDREDAAGLSTSAGARAYIHQELGKGVYKSTPATPRTVTPTRGAFGVGDVDVEGGGKGVDVSEEDQAGGVTSSPKAGRTRKKARKRSKTLVHAKSFPNLRHAAKSDMDEEGISSEAGPLLDQSKRNRLISLATRLQASFPEQHKDLMRIVQRLESTGRKPPSAGLGSGGLGRKRSRHSRNSSKGGSGATAASILTMASDGNGVDDAEQDPAELDVINKGPSPGDGGPLIHIFIDHSNILIGLLNFLKRCPPPPRVVSDYLAAQSAKSSSFGDGTISSLHSASKAVNIPGGKTNESRKDFDANPFIESPTDKYRTSEESPIPLPSFATSRQQMAPPSSNGHAKLEQNPEMSKSLPTTSGLDAHMEAMRKRNAANRKSIQGVMSDGYEDGPYQDRESSGPETGGLGDETKKAQKKFPRHLWHAAFVLILERGRAVSRRVVVTSSPLYQPMEKIQNLGYEVRVYIRVPDMGDGMDRERKDAKHNTSRPTYGGKGTTAFKKTHTRHISGSTSADSGNAASFNMYASSQHGVQGGGTPTSAAGNSTTVTGRIKYREQGVDELLQLKLHQAIADADVVPSGSTIVLATGDGNVGQFNEDGFLGPVRTALKRGWKVELYAWEDGLSRSWRREFGENSDWGRRGLFRIIPLEQFATSLVEASGW